MSQPITCDLEVSSETQPSLSKAGVFSTGWETWVEGLHCGDETPTPLLGKPQAPASSPCRASFYAVAHRRWVFCMCLGCLELGRAGWYSGSVGPVEETRTRCLREDTTSTAVSSAPWFLLLFEKQETSTMYRSCLCFSRTWTFQAWSQFTRWKKSSQNTHTSVSTAWLRSPGLGSSLAPGCAEGEAAWSFPASPKRCFCICPSKKTSSSQGILIRSYSNLNLFLFKKENKK